MLASRHYSLRTVESVRFTSKKSKAFNTGGTEEGKRKSLGGVQLEISCQLLASILAVIKPT